MGTAEYLFIANAAIWLGVGGYVCFLGLKVSGLDKRIRQLELLRDDD